MSIPRVIFMSGKKGSGKDTFGRILIEEMCLSKAVEVGKQIAFADPLKDSAREIFLLTDEQMYGSLKEVVDDRWQMTPREIMQRIGTEVGRNIHKDVWVINAIERIKDFFNSMKITRQRGVVVLTDCRFKNEVEMPKELWQNQFKVIRIERPGLPTTDFDNHPSECDLDDYQEFDEIIINDKGIEELHGAAISLIAKWKVEKY